MPGEAPIAPLDDCGDGRRKFPLASESAPRIAAFPDNAGWIVLEGRGKRGGIARP